MAVATSALQDSIKGYLIQSLFINHLPYSRKPIYPKPYLRRLMLTRTRERNIDFVERESFIISREIDFCRTPHV